MGERRHYKQAEQDAQPQARAAVPSLRASELPKGPLDLSARYGHRRVVRGYAVGGGRRRP